MSAVTVAADANARRSLASLCFWHAGLSLALWLLYRTPAFDPISRYHVICMGICSSRFAHNTIVYNYSSDVVFVLREYYIVITFIVLMSLTVLNNIICLLSLCFNTYDNNEVLVYYLYILLPVNITNTMICLFHDD